MMQISKNSLTMQVKMTTGATIHTTEGLKMTVTRRMKPPIMPMLDMPAVTVEAPVNVSSEEPKLGQKGEVSTAHS